MTDPRNKCIGFTANKASRHDVAGIGFKKQVRKCSEHIYVSRIADDSIFASSDLSVGDEVVSIEVPAAAMSAAEAARLVRDSEGYVTVAAARETPGAAKSARLLRRNDSDRVAATAWKRCRNAEAGLGFETCVREGRERMVVSDIEEDSIFAGTDLHVDDEVVSIEIGVDGRTASEVADLIRVSEGDITLFVVDRMADCSSSVSERQHYKFGDITRGIVARGKQKAGRDASARYQFGDFTRGLIG